MQINLLGGEGSEVDAEDPDKLKLADALKRKFA